MQDFAGGKYVTYTARGDLRFRFVEVRASGMARARGRGALRPFYTGHRSRITARSAGAQVPSPLGNIKGIPPRPALSGVFFD